jgi:predicted ATP-binding protein involved in virulence
MRAHEIIRTVLDLIDQIETDNKQQETAEEYYDDERRRMNQISDLTHEPDLSAYANKPIVAYASIEAVTTDAGGGTNAPKHPADIRSDSVAMYPGRVFGAQ